MSRKTTGQKVETNGGVELSAEELEGLHGGSSTIERAAEESDGRSGTRSSGSDNLAAQVLAHAGSDARFKTNIETLPDALQRVASLNGVSYDWRRAEFPDQDFPEGRTVGILAQEVERVLPEAVVTGPNGYKAVYYAQLIPLLIESVKELKAQNQELRDMIADRATARPNQVLRRLARPRGAPA